MKNKLLAGVDEVGRGCLAGPVCACALILPDNYNIPGLADSKKLSAKQRQALSKLIKQQALAYKVAFIDNTIIDKINILQASLLAMQQAVLGLAIRPDLVQVDGNQMPDLASYQVETIIKGDSKIAAISAASIIAKVARDELMINIDTQYPEYGFAAHKGYGTKAHLEALTKHGPTTLHRMSFAPLR